MNKVTHHSSETYRSSLQLSRKRSDTSILNSRFSITNKKNPNSNHSICVLMLQTYLSDILKTLSSTNTISNSSYQKLFSMKKILNDCMSISKISLEFLLFSRFSFKLYIKTLLKPRNLFDTRLNSTFIKNFFIYFFLQILGRYHFYSNSRQ
jgi:hypothetical protein